MNVFKNGLYIVSTPIGNLEDVSLRAINIFKAADVIICENPKHSLKLLNNLGIKKKLLSLHDYNEEKIIKNVQKHYHNSLIVLISDAGSPLISDPGYNLVQYFINNNIYVTSIPGASSLITGLQLSGLPLNNFIFWGFVPKNTKLFKNLIKNIADSSLTSVLYISGIKLKKFLEALESSLIDRQIAICKELTKINETIYRGEVKKIINLIEKEKINLKGEFTVVIGGVKKNQTRTVDNEIIYKTSKLLKKYTLTETVEIVHKLTNISKKEIYKMALKIQND